MVFSFARIGAVIQMKVGDYFVQGRRRWVRLHEKGGKEHDVPCHHRLDQCLHDYIEAAGIADDTDGYLFRTARRKTGQLTTMNRRGQPSFMTADRTRFLSMRLSESRSKKTPVTDLFDNHHHERISGSRPRNRFAAFSG